MADDLRINLILLVLLTVCVALHTIFTQYVQASAMAEYRTSLDADGNHVIFTHASNLKMIGTPTGIWNGSGPHVWSHDSQAAVPLRQACRT
jgi:hypothetical protein